MQFKQLGNMFGDGEIWSIFNGGGLKSANFKTASSISDMQNITQEMFNKQFRINSEGLSEFTKSQIEAKANAIGLTESLKNEVVAMASDADFTDKLRSGKLTWKQAYKDVGDNVDELAEALLKNNKVSKESLEHLKAVKEVGNINRTKEAIKDTIEATDGLGDSFIQLEKTTSSDSGFFTSARNLGKGLLVQLKAIAPYAAAIAAVYGAYKLFEYSQSGYTRAEEALSKSSSKYEQDKSDIQSLNQELDQTKSRIEELKALQADGTITFADEVELQKLENTNTELERQLELKQEIAEKDAEKASADAKIASETEQSYLEHMREKDGKFFGTIEGIAGYATHVYDENGLDTGKTFAKQWKEENSGNTSIPNQFKKNVADLKDYKKELADVKEKLISDSENEDLLAQQSQLNDKISETTDALSTESDTIQKWIDSSKDSNGNIRSDMVQEVYDWTKILREYTDMDKTAREKSLSHLDDYFSTAGTNMKDYLTNIVKNGGSAQDALEAFWQTGMKLSDIGVSSDYDFIRYFEDIKKSAEEANDSVADYSATVSDIETATQSENKDKDWSTVQSAYKSALELQEKGKTGTDDFQSVVSFLNPSRVKELVEEAKKNGTYIGDAYEQALNESKARANRWYGENEETSMTNFVKDMRDVGMWEARIDDSGRWDIVSKFESTAQAAKATGASINEIEMMLHSLEAYGYDFSGIKFSGEEFTKAKDYLSKLQDLYDGLENSEAKKRLKTKLDEWTPQIEAAEDDLSSLPDEIVTKLKFEYDRAELQQKVDDATKAAKNSGMNDISANASAITAVENYNEHLSSNVDLNSIDVQKVPILFDLQNAKKDLQEQLASGNLSQEQTLKVQAQLLNADQLEQEVWDAFYDANPEITPETDMSVATAAFDAWVSSAEGQEILAKINYETGNTPQEVPNAKGKADYTVGSSPSTVNKPASGIANYLGKFPTSAPTIYGKAVYTTTATVSSAGAVKNSVSKSIGIIKNRQLNGSAHLLGSAKSNGDWSVKKSEKALVGELGTETIVRNGKYYTVGDNGAEFTNVRKGDVIFNHIQTRELFKNGHVTSGGGRAKVVGESFVQGTAYRLKAQDKKKTSSKSKKKSRKSSGNSGKSSRSGKSRGSGSSDSSSSSSSKDTENLTDWIKIFLSRNSRLTDLSEDAIDRAIGLINKMSAATDTISKVNNEISANQQAANKYLEYANQVGLSEDYKSKIRNGQLSIENITDENTRDLVSKYQEYYEAYLDAQDKVLDLQDKLTDLAEKRLEIIEKEYNSIEDIQTSLQDRLEADRDLLKSLGTAINNSLNVESLNESVKAQEEIYNQLTKKLADYQAEVDSQLKSGLMKQGSEQWYDAMKNINDFTANIAKASSELIELSDKLREIKYDTLKYIIDGFSRSTDKLSAYIDLLGSRDEKVPEELYQQQIDNNNASIQKQYALREEKLKEQGLYDVGSERYQDLAEDISKADEEILKLRKDNEDLKDSIYELRISNLEKTIQGYSDLEDELKDMRDLLNDDAFLDKNGGITDEGLAQIALLSQSLGNAKKIIADYTTGLQKLKELYENGIISLDEYNDKSAEYRKGIREATSDVKSYQDSLTNLYTDALKAEVDALDKIIDKRKKALEAKEDYYNYDKKIRSQQKDVDTIKAQIAALEGVNDAASQAKLKKLKQDLADAEDTLSETQRDHRNDMISQGFSKISDDMADMLENTTYEISHNADKQLEIINSMLNKAVGSYQEAYNKISSIITNTGFVGSTDFNNNQSQLGSSEGVKNQVSNASQSQTEANKNPSSSASGTVTSPIKDNKAENDRITNDIMKPEDTTNRKVAELKVSKSSVSVQEGQGTTLTYTIRPNDAVNKNLSISYSAPTIATASATNGVISINGLRPGSVTVTISTIDGSNFSQTVNITVTKKPDPPKPAPAPPVNTSGGDGVPRVGDVVTFTGKYYNDSWGARPIGRLYSGVQGGVVIDGRSARAYGGSARRTGDYSVHIKSADGRYGDLGWVKLSQLSGYKDGTLGVADDEYAWTGEGYKSELIVRNDGAILTHMNKGDGVVPNPETLKLMKFTEKYLNGEGELDLAVANLAQNSFVQEAIDGMKMAQSQNVSNMKKMGNVTVDVNQPVTFNGVSKNDIPTMEEFLKRAREDTTKYIVKELRKGGMQIKR